MSVLRFAGEVRRSVLEPNCDGSCVFVIRAMSIECISIVTSETLFSFDTATAPRSLCRHPLDKHAVYVTLAGGRLELWREAKQERSWALDGDLLGMATVVHRQNLAVLHRRKAAGEKVKFALEVVNLQGAGKAPTLRALREKKSEIVAFQTVKGFVIYAERERLVAVNIDQAHSDAHGAGGERPGKVTHRSRAGEITCMAVSSDGTLATGHRSGRISVWYGCTTAKASVASLHWHAHGVSTLCFLPDGRHLLSGGEEGVLVKWHVESGAKDFLPRLGGPLSRIAATGDASRAVILTETNELWAVDPGGFQRHWHRRMLTLTTPPDSVDRAGFLKLCKLPHRQGLCMNAPDGAALQFFDPGAHVLQQRFDCLPHNRASRGAASDDRVVPPVLQHFAFSRNMRHLATADFTGQGPGDSASLKFWESSEGGWKLTSVCDAQSFGGVTGLAFHPVRNAVFCSTGGGDLMAFGLRGEDQDAHWARTWRLRLREGDACGAVAVSADGSALCVAHGDLLSFWEPSAALLIRTLPLGELCGGDIEEVHFLPGPRSLVLCRSAGAIFAVDPISGDFALRVEGECLACAVQEADGVGMAGHCLFAAAFARPAGGAAVLLYDCHDCAAPLFKWSCARLRALAFYASEGSTAAAPDAALVALSEEADMILLDTRDAQRDLRAAANGDAAPLLRGQAAQLGQRLGISGEQRGERRARKRSRSDSVLAEASGGRAADPMAAFDMDTSRLPRTVDLFEPFMRAALGSKAGAGAAAEGPAAASPAGAEANGQRKRARGDAAGKGKHRGEGKGSPRAAPMQPLGAELLPDLVAFFAGAE